MERCARLALAYPVWKTGTLLVMLTPRVLNYTAPASNLRPGVLDLDLWNFNIFLNSFYTTTLSGRIVSIIDIVLF
jgi:hypothetical protein